MERILTYTVGYEQVVPRAPRFAGVQGEHRVTCLVIEPDAELSIAVEQETGRWDHIGYRVDFTDGAGNFICGEVCPIDQIGQPFYLTRAMTKAGGNAQAVFKIFCFNDGTEGVEFYSAPIRLYFEACRSVLSAEEETLSLLSPIVQQAKGFRDEAYDCAQVAVSAGQEITEMVDEGRQIGEANTRSAGLAASSAETAVSAASTASQAASTAQTAAGTATVEAGHAQSNANIAGNAADRAEAAELNARGSATQAQTAAAQTGLDAQSTAADVLSAVANAQSAQTYAGQAALSAQAAQSAAESVDINKAYVNNTFANAVKGRLFGASVTADDVSPVEHELSVELSSKNLSSVAVYSNATWIVLHEGLKTAFNALPAGVYTLSMDFTLTARNNVADTSLYGVFVANIIQSALVEWGPVDVGTTKRYIRTFTITPEQAGQIQSVYVYGCGSGGATGAATISQVQIEKGSVATAYTSKVSDFSSVTVSVTDGEQTQSAVADEGGTVSGLHSYDPSMSLSTDHNGVLIECVYNRDLNMVIDRLIAAISGA